MSTSTDITEFKHVTTAQRYNTKKNFVNSKLDQFVADVRQGIESMK